MEEDLMRCGLLLPAGSSPLQLDPIGPVLTADLRLEWSGTKRALRLSAVVDTGCPVDLVASEEVAGVLRDQLRPARMETLDWGGRLETEVYNVDLKLDVWTRIEVHAPLESFEENLLGLRALLKANLCLRGEDGSAYWAKLPAAGESWDFITRDAETEARRAPVAMASRVKRKRGVHSSVRSR